MEIFSSFIAVPVGLTLTIYLEVLKSQDFSIFGHKMTSLHQFAHFIALGNHSITNDCIKKTPDLCLAVIVLN